MHITTYYGEYTLPFLFKYDDVTKAECELDFKSTDIKDKIKCKWMLVQYFHMVANRLVLVSELFAYFRVVNFSSLIPVTAPTLLEPLASSERKPPGGF